LVIELLVSQRGQQFACNCFPVTVSPQQKLTTDLEVGTI
jgi:hypothetical protein